MTKIQRAALLRLAAHGSLPATHWAVGSMTVNGLRALGFITSQRGVKVAGGMFGTETVHTITDAGRKEVGQ